MSLVTFVSLSAALAIGFFPVWLLRRTRPAPEVAVVTPRVPLAVVRNSAIAYVLRTAAFVPLFAWGASGDLLPATVASVCFGVGTWLVYVARRPLLAFLDDAITGGESVSVHAFIARAHGNDPRVRRAAAGIALLALLALLTGEALAAYAFLGPMLMTNTALGALLMVAALLTLAATAALSGEAGIMHSAQLQLGILYFGLFGATLVVLYLHVSARAPMPPHVGLAVAFAPVFAALVLWYRRSRYVDTETIGNDGTGGSAGVSRAARVLARFGKILNGALSVLLVLIVILAVMDLRAADASALSRESVAAFGLGQGARIPGPALIALTLLPLSYPLVDVTNWLRLAAARKGAGLDSGDGAAELRRAFAVYALETTLVGLLVCALGAIAGAVFAPKASTDIVTLFALRIASPDSGVVAIASALFAVCIAAAALSTMGTLLGAALYTLRHDLRAPARHLATREAPAQSDSTSRNRTLLTSLAALALVAAAVAALRVGIGGASSIVVALVSTLCCAQLAFAPLVLGPVIARAPTGNGAVSAGWALAILVCGFGAAVAAIVGYLVTGRDVWLWNAVPAALGSGIVLFVLGRAASSRAR